MEYIVSTPKNPQFSGKTCGVVFRNGRAFVSKHTIDPLLGWSVEEVARKMEQDFGYVVEPVEEEPKSFVAAANKTNRKKRGKAEAAVASEVAA
jgi:hypothetical protein